MSWYGTVRAGKLRDSLSSVVVFDLETTGIHTMYAEILQIAICDGYGNLLYSSYVHPDKARSWPVAEKVNHISPAMVADAPRFEEIRSTVQSFFDRARYVAGYNCICFDIPIIQRYGIRLGNQQIFDVMRVFRDFDPVVRHRLVDCAKKFHVPYSPHDATEDARATARCMQALLSSEGFCKEIKRERKDRRVRADRAEGNETTDIVSGNKYARRSRLTLPVLWLRHPLLWGMLLVLIGTGLQFYQIEASEKEIYGLIAVGGLVALFGVFRILRALWLGMKSFFRRLFSIW